MKGKLNGRYAPYEEDKAKTLPVCYRFILGTCLDENCPYPHVNVNPRADVCSDFLAGYCPRGSACKQLHTYECQSWVRTGECNDPSCTFKHPSNVRGVRRSKSPGDKATTIIADIRSRAKTEEAKHIGQDDADRTTSSSDGEGIDNDEEEDGNSEHESHTDQSDESDAATPNRWPSPTSLMQPQR